MERLYGMNITDFGKFVVDRKIALKFIRSDQKMCDYGAWVWILSQAAFNQHDVNYRGRIICLNKGEYPITYRKLAQLFNWSVNRVIRFIKQLVQQKFVNTSTSTGFLIITICNYSKIQKFTGRVNTGLNTAVDIEDDTNSKTSTDTNRTKGNKLKEINKEKNAPHTQQWKIRLSEDIGSAAYKSWLSKAHYEDGVVYLDNESKVQWCCSHYYSNVKDALNSCGMDFEGFSIDLMRDN